ncbi:methyltransferase [Stappia sp. ES.058]|uniref:methyltransferase n=1 Tax=Stappia sp. ES.058 TaxID=1881061 RepID=UPI00087DEB3F|nr:methyltransferase [Stappia sp. ES.058]SDT96437.1 demethylspheroidene O-methyltransferase [Stappia sp. ES.058]
MDAAAPATHPRSPHASRSFAARLRGWRNRLIASASFQNRVASLPGLRWIARRNARDLFRINAGFLYSQVLFASLDSGLLSALRDDGQSAEALARTIDLPVAALSRLLIAARGLKLVTQLEDGTWWLDDLGAVVAGNPGIAAMIRHHAMVYRDLADPLALLRSATETETSSFWAYAGRQDGAGVDTQTAAAYSDLMHLSQDLIATEVLRAYDFSRHRTLLDIGGGDGTFLASVARPNPHLELMLFDLPAVAVRAETAMRERGVGERTRCFGGSFFDNPIPSGADCLSLVRVLCDHEDAAVLSLLRAIRAAMTPQDTLLIAEPMAGTDDDRRFAAAYFEFYFLAMRSGHCRTPEHLSDLLKQAGFSRIRERRTSMPLFAGLLVAHV